MVARRRLMEAEGCDKFLQKTYMMTGTGAHTTPPARQQCVLNKIPLRHIETSKLLLSVNIADNSRADTSHRLRVDRFRGPRLPTPWSRDPRTGKHSTTHPSPRQTPAKPTTPNFALLKPQSGILLKEAIRPLMGAPVRNSKGSTAQEITARLSSRAELGGWSPAGARLAGPMKTLSNYVFLLLFLSTSHFMI